MEAKKCDRCGAFYEYRELTPMESAVEAVKRMVNLVNKKECKPDFNNDLCVGCQISLRAWWKGANDGKAD